MEKIIAKSVIIVAGGSGSRMTTETPKQFLLLTGRPVLMHTIQKFYNCFPDIRIVLVLPFGHIELWNRLISEHRFLIPHQIIAGGKERFFSVKNGLKMINDEGLVAIHDGVRPLVSDEVIKKSFQMAQAYGGAIPVIPPAESLRKVENDNTYPANREHFRLVQTPQTFNTALLKKAYEQAWEAKFTDDATVFEADNNKVHLFDGNRENIKITWPADIHFAEAMMKHK